MLAAKRFETAVCKSFSGTSLSPVKKGRIQFRTPDSDHISGHAYVTFERSTCGRVGMDGRSSSTQAVSDRILSDRISYSGMSSCLTGVFPADTGTGRLLGIELNRDGDTEGDIGWYLGIPLGKLMRFSSVGRISTGRMSMEGRISIRSTIGRGSNRSMAGRISSRSILRAKSRSEHCWGVKGDD